MNIELFQEPSDPSLVAWQVLKDQTKTPIVRGDAFDQLLALRRGWWGHGTLEYFVRTTALSCARRVLAPHGLSTDQVDWEGLGNEALLLLFERANRVLQDPKYWLRGVILNLVRHEVRVNWRHLSASELTDVAAETLQASNDPPRISIKATATVRAISSLDPALREVAEHLSCGYSTRSDVRDALGISGSTLRKRIERLRKALRHDVAVASSRTQTASGDRNRVVAKAGRDPRPPGSRDSFIPHRGLSSAHEPGRPVCVCVSNDLPRIRMSNQLLPVPDGAVAHFFRTSPCSASLYGLLHSPLIECTGGGLLVVNIKSGSGDVLCFYNSMGGVIDIKLFTTTRHYDNPGHNTKVLLGDRCFGRVAYFVEPKLEQNENPNDPSLCDGTFEPALNRHGRATQGFAFAGLIECGHGAGAIVGEIKNRWHVYLGTWGEADHAAGSLVPGALCSAPGECADRRAHPASHVLLAPGHAGGGDAGGAGTGGSSGSDNDPAVFAPEPGRVGRHHSIAGIESGRVWAWRNIGDD